MGEMGAEIWKRNQDVLDGLIALAQGADEIEFQELIGLLVERGDGEKGWVDTTVERTLWELAHFGAVQVVGRPRGQRVVRITTLGRAWLAQEMLPGLRDLPGIRDAVAGLGNPDLNPGSLADARREARFEAAERLANKFEREGDDMPYAIERATEGWPEDERAAFAKIVYDKIKRAYGLRVDEDPR